MNDRILVSVYVISIDQSYEIYIPLARKIGNCVELMCKTIKQFNGDGFNYENGYLLMDGDTGVMYDLNVVVADSGIKNGSKLILF